MEDNYEDLLNRAYEEMPKTALVNTERFEIPKVKGHLQGNKTIIVNISQIAGDLRRDVHHVVKYLLKELATPGKLGDNGSLIMGTKVAASRINDKVKQYVDEFVLCGECGKPDTQLAREEGIVFKRCTACGAKKVIRHSF